MGARAQVAQALYERPYYQFFFFSIIIEMCIEIFLIMLTFRHVWVDNTQKINSRNLKFSMNFYQLQSQLLSLTFSRLICAEPCILLRNCSSPCCQNHKKLLLTPKVAQKLSSTIGTGLVILRYSFALLVISDILWSSCFEWTKKALVKSG